jgi:hypothetical protein
MITRGAWLVGMMFLAAICVINRGAQAQNAASEHPAIRIGTYDSRAVALASRNSGAMQRKIVMLQKQLKQAEDAGDRKQAQEIKDRGEAMQVLAHMQVFSNGPIDNIIESIHNQLPAIAEQQKVMAIVPHLDIAAPGVEVVDVTDALVAALGPDEKTLKIIADLRTKPPIDIVDALLIKD